MDTIWGVVMKSLVSHSRNYLNIHRIEWMSREKLILVMVNFQFYFCSKVMFSHIIPYGRHATYSINTYYSVVKIVNNIVGAALHSRL